MMRRESMLEQLLHLIIARSVYFFLDFPRILTVKQMFESFAFRLQNVAQLHRRVVGLGALVHEDDNLLLHF